MVRIGSWLLTVEPLLVGELLGHDQRIRLREKDQRIVDGFVGPLQIVVAEVAVAEHVHAENQQIAFAGRDGGLDHRRGRAHLGQAREPCPERLRRSRLASRYLELRRARDAIDGLVETPPARSGSPCACPTNTATPSTMPAVVSSQRSRCLRA